MSQNAQSKPTAAGQAVPGTTVKMPYPNPAMLKPQDAWENYRNFRAKFLSAISENRFYLAKLEEDYAQHITQFRVQAVAEQKKQEAEVIRIQKMLDAARAKEKELKEIAGVSATLKTRNGGSRGESRSTKAVELKKQHADWTDAKIATEAGLTAGATYAALKRAGLK